MFKERPKKLLSCKAQAGPQHTSRHSRCLKFYRPLSDASLDSELVLLPEALFCRARIRSLTTMSTLCDPILFSFIT
ncbi:hypothetical protein SAMN04515618_10649 [Collimonas sp. OK307]|nr:hypothetical protein SAMN04515618_10649 [Collimonas sp. OK307]